MTLILAIDTSFGTSVALIENGLVRAEHNVPDTMKHAELIGSSIAAVLEKASVHPNQLMAVVAGRGPAPFTGLRVGIAAATMFAAGVGIKLYGAVSLDAIALAALKSSTATVNEPLLITADARRKEVYWALYSGLNEQGVPIRVDGPGVMKPAELEEYLVNRNVHPSRTGLPISAANLGLLLEAQLRAGSAGEDVSALYLRAADAVEPKARIGKAVSG
jgi:tRNA threonylcarbamoyl adenosine modification protein YeaZ